MLPLVSQQHEPWQGQVQTPLLHVIWPTQRPQAWPAPHRLWLCCAKGTQVFPLQQPLGHEVALHTQLPPTHCWPAAHAAPPPQAQAPTALQLSAVVGSQAVQRLPAAPQAVSDGVMQPPRRPQQPRGQEVWSHTQAPPTQCVPVPQAGPVPQLHTPLVQVSVLPAGQVRAQAPPPVPQAAGWFTWHTPPWQQPVGHDVASQTQAPREQRCPAEQAAPGPQWHAPPAQLSAFVASHDAQAAPPAPQVLALGALQVVPEQQPFGQEVASHTQAPPTQRWPAPHAAPGPQWQPPPMQLSAFVASQAVHAPPAAPQVARLAGLQVVPEQQPPGQLVASQPEQAPLVQVPDGQPWHAAPPEPQAEVVVPLWQTLPAQQPVGQEVGSHTQAPPTQRWPAPQAAVAPQRQAPLAQESAFVASHAVQAAPPVPQLEADAVTQAPEASQQPLGQVAAVQVPPQAPLLQLTPLPQAAHWAPFFPHASLALPRSQAPAAQQPPQEAAVH